MRTQRHGFTLIELLVVISIIAILAGLLLPAITSAREKARQLEATSNVKQISMAMFQYAEESGSSAPRIQDLDADSAPADATTITVQGFELLAATQELAFGLFNSQGTGETISEAPQTVSELQALGDAETGNWEETDLSFGWDWSAPAASPGVRAVFAERVGAWGNTQVSVAFGDHSAAPIQNPDDTFVAEVYVNDKVSGDTDDDIFVEETDDLNGKFGRGPRQRAFVRTGGETDPAGTATAP